MDDKGLILVDWKRLKAMGWPYSRTSTYRMVADGRFPKFLKLGPARGARIAWRWKDIKSFFESLDPQSPDD